jgi:hypothetical protein
LIINWLAIRNLKSLDNTYIIKTELIIPTSTASIEGQIIGSWKQQDNSIIFVNSQIYLPDYNSFVNYSFVKGGKPVSSFFGYIYNHLEGNSRPSISIDIYDKRLHPLCSCKQLTNLI